MASRRASTTVPCQVVEMLDRLAKRRNTSRSALVREAIVGFVQTLSTWEDLQADASERPQKPRESSEDDIQRLVDKMRGRAD